MYICNACTFVRMYVPTYLRMYVYPRRDGLGGFQFGVRQILWELSSLQASKAAARLVRYDLLQAFAPCDNGWENASLTRLLMHDAPSLGLAIIGLPKVSM